MRSLRLLFAFLLGAFSMLAAVIVTGRLGPGAWAVGRGPQRTVDSSVVAPAPAGPTETSWEDGPAQVPTSSSSRSVGVPPDEGLLIPVQGVPATSLVDTYEQARGEGRRHDAIDIMASRGTPVVATADGAVMKLFQSSRGGITLYQLAADQRTIYYYAHLDGYAPGIAEGRALRRGEVLGYVGNSGDAGPGNYHLHFEVSTTADSTRYWGGVPRNPYPLLR